MVGLWKAPMIGTCQHLTQVGRAWPRWGGLHDAQIDPRHYRFWIAWLINSEARSPIAIPAAATRFVSLRRIKGFKVPILIYPIQDAMHLVTDSWKNIRYAATSPF